MRRTRIWRRMAALALALLGGAPAARAETAAVGDVTVITSDRLTFDYKNRYALF